MQKAHPGIADYLLKFGLPAAVAEREPEDTERVRKLWAEDRRQVEQRGRRFHLDLMLAFVAVAEEVCRQLGKGSCAYAPSRFPPAETCGGKRLNSLNLPVSGAREIGLSGYHDKADQTVRFELARRSYPSKNRYATKHFHDSGHPIVASFGSGGYWRRCYVYEVLI